MSVYVPDRVIARRLREYDSNLYLEWDADRERWVVMSRHSDGLPREIFVVQNAIDNSFRPLDDRVLAQIHAADVLHRHGSVAEMIRVLDENNHLLEDSQRKIIRDQICQVASEELYPATFGGPKIVAGIDLKGSNQ